MSNVSEIKTRWGRPALGRFVEKVQKLVDSLKEKQEQDLAGVKRMVSMRKNIVEKGKIKKWKAERGKK